MKKRILSLALLCALVLSQFACGTQSDVQSDTTESESTTTAATSDETELSDDLPDKTFGGRTFTTLAADYMESGYIADEANGDVINDAVYKRNQAVMERFDIELVTKTDTYNNVAQTLQSSVMAGDDEYQLVANHVIRFGGAVMSDILLNWYDVPYVDFSKPWWSDSTVNDMTYNGVALLAVGDYALDSLGRTYCIFYNKKSAEEYHFGNLYDVVYDGKWTIDYIINLCKDVYSDLNGNGQQDGEDFYGFTTAKTSPIDAFLWSSGGKIFTKTSDGKLEYNYNNEHTVEILEKLYKMCYESDGITVNRPQYEDNNNSHYIARHSFIDSLSAMIPGTLNMTVEYFRELDFDYGILPYPKFDEDQDEYYTMVDGGHAALGVPKSVEDLEFVGIITEALNAESHKIVFPAYYEVALKVKYTRDDESVKMLDMIVDSRVFDFGYVYDNWKGVSFFFEWLIRNESTDFASYYAQNGQTAEAYYEELIEYFDSVSNN